MTMMPLTSLRMLRLPDVWSRASGKPNLKILHQDSKVNLAGFVRGAGLRQFRMAAVMERPASA